MNEGMSMLKKLLVAGVLIAGSSVSGLAQDAQKGKAIFNVCLACHAIGPGAQSKIGPELNGIDGRKAGTVPNFDYSDANKNSGIVWNEETFEDYIKNPAADEIMLRFAHRRDKHRRTYGDRATASLSTEA